MPSSGRFGTKPFSIGVGIAADDLMRAQIFLVSRDIYIGSFVWTSILQLAFVRFDNCGLKGALVLFFNRKGETVWLDHLKWIYEAHIGGESTILGLTLLDCKLFPSIHPWEITLFVMATIAFAAISSSSLSRTLLSLPFITACSQPNIQKKHCCQDCKIDSFSVSKSTYYEFTESFHKLLLTSEVEKATRSRIWNSVL